MRQTIQAGRRSSAGPLADAGPYDYDLPVTHGDGSQPLPPAPTPAPRRKWTSTGVYIAQSFGIIFLNFCAQSLRDWTGWRLLDCYIVVYAGITLLGYWSKPRPQQSFPRWALKMIGIGLNCYVALVTVPESLHGKLPDGLAFGLPAFLITALLYCVAPAKPDTGKKWPFWQWLLLAGWAAVVWGWSGPLFLK